MGATFGRSASRGSGQRRGNARAAAPWFRPPERQGIARWRDARGRPLRALAALVGLLSALAGAPASAAPSLPPLDIPVGLGPTPEQQAELAPEERIARGAAALTQRGYPELPVLALALVRPGASPAAIERAVALAPGIPAVRIEAAVARRSPLDLLAALLGLTRSLPCLEWLASLVGAAVLAGLGLAALALALLAIARTFSLHTHALGHRLGSSFEPTIAVALIGLASVLTAGGLGPGALVWALGLVGTLRLPGRAAAACGTTLALACLAAGPGLEWWSRLAISAAEQPALGVVWRVERAQPLPGDAELLEREVESHADDPIYRLALATHHKRRGELDRALADLEGIPVTAPPALRARAANLGGIIALARGDFQSALARFERARSTEESAAVLYNLSQAHARNLALEKRAELFTAARNMDSDLISRQAARAGSSIHDYLIQEPVPTRFLVARLFAPSPRAEAFAAELRERLLGFQGPAALWLVLGALAAFAPWLSRTDQLRCRRCDRPLCRACAPGAVALRTCPRCEKLGSGRGRADARLRPELAEADEQGQRALRWQRAALSALLPGVGAWLGERPFLACARIWGIACALALPWSARSLAAPFEVGRLAEWLPAGTALGACAALCVWALLDARAWLTGRGP